MKVVVLGVGLIGAAIVKDLSYDSEFEVTASDINGDVLKNLICGSEVKKKQVDLSDKRMLVQLIDDADIVVNAVPGFMGFDVLKMIIKTGKSVVDISFAPENVLELDGLAKEKNVSVFFDCGVAPGMSNMLVGRGHSLLDTTEFASIYVGGLPIVRQLPYEYKAGFSPIDVIEEYTRPVFSLIDSKIVEKEALSDVELVDFDKVGTLEAFNTDGLRSLIKTLDIPNMQEKTLRYPGHIKKINFLKESGFFSTKAINLNGSMVQPIDLTTKLLFPMWKLGKGEEDITIMKVIVGGRKLDRLVRYEYELYDRYDSLTGVHSMARTTGYTSTMVLRLIRDKNLNTKGVIAPEMIGMDGQYMDFIFDGLRKRGVSIEEKEFVHSE